MQPPLTPNLLTIQSCPRGMQLGLAAWLQRCERLGLHPHNTHSQRYQ